MKIARLLPRSVRKLPNKSQVGETDSIEFCHGAVEILIPFPREWVVFCRMP